MNTDIQSRIRAARTTLLLDFEFFGILAMRLVPVMDDTLDTEACTNGKEVRFHPDKCAKLSDPELVWLWAHETGHPACGDPWRFKGRDHELANRAADYKINQLIEDVMRGRQGAEFRMKPLPGILRDRRFDQFSREQVYDLLQKEKQDENPQTSRAAAGNMPGAFTDPPPPTPAAGEDGEDPDEGGGEGQPGDGTEPSDDNGDGTLTQGSDDDLEQEWKDAVTQAVAATRMRQRGALPAGIEEAVKELTDPVVPWQDLLRQFAAIVTRDDYTWKRPNRRYAHQGIMLPTLRSEGLGTLAIVRDTSGSITNEINTAVLSEVQDILDTCRPARIDLIDCDARVQQHLEFLPGDDLRGTHYRGGGGTRFEPAFDYIEDKLPEPPAAIIYLTDLYGSFPATPPQIPTLWLNYGMPRNSAPFGETVDIPAA
jgi:predicted metal-dependent peptidase